MRSIVVGVTAHVEHYCQTTYKQQLYRGITLTELHVCVV